MKLLNSMAPNSFFLFKTTLVGKKRSIISNQTLFLWKVRIFRVKREAFEEGQLSENSLMKALKGFPNGPVCYAPPCLPVHNFLFSRTFHWRQCKLCSDAYLPKTEHAEAFLIAGVRLVASGKTVCATIPHSGQKSKPWVRAWENMCSFFMQRRKTRSSS